LAIAEIAKEKDWIGNADMKQLVPVDKAAYIPLSTPGTPAPTVGYKFYSGHEENKCIFTLPKPESSEPIHGWIRINSRMNYDDRMRYLKEYIQCVKDIAASITYIFKPANYYEEIDIFTDTENLRRGGKVLGGMWIHRLAFLLFHVRLGHTEQWILTLLEETFHGKARCSSVVLEDINLFSLNITKSECASTAHSLASRICEAKGTDYSILRLNALNICTSTLVIGLGLQYEAIEEHRNETYTMYYPCRSPKTHTSDKDNTD